MDLLCRELEVSRSGYYAWKKHSPDPRALENQAISRRLVELHAKYPALGLDSRTTFCTLIMAVPASESTA